MDNNWVTHQTETKRVDDGDYVQYLVLSFGLRAALRRSLGFLGRRWTTRMKRITFTSLLDYFFNRLSHYAASTSKIKALLMYRQEQHACRSSELNDSATNSRPDGGRNPEFGRNAYALQTDQSWVLGVDR
jgi:hypothetical protein